MIGAVLVAAALTIALHRADGYEVIVATSHVTSLRTPAGSLTGLAPIHGCIVGLDDGKWVGVLEGCGEVRRRLEEAGH